MTVQQLSDIAKGAQEANEALAKENAALLAQLKDFLEDNIRRTTRLSLAAEIIGPEWQKDHPAQQRAYCPDKECGRFQEHGHKPGCLRGEFFRKESKA